MTGLNGPFVICHNVEDARRAIACARTLELPLRILSARGAAGTIGPAVFRVLIDEALSESDEAPAVDAFIDCADNPGFAMKALDEGCNVRIDAELDVVRKLRDIAGEGLSIITDDIANAFDLAASSQETLEQWLSRQFH